MPVCMLLRFAHRFKISAFGLLECFFWGRCGRMVKKKFNIRVHFDMFHILCVNYVHKFY